MIIRIYESGKLDLETVGDMLWQADAQSNFHPDARWTDMCVTSTYVDNALVQLEPDSSDSDEGS